MIPTEIKPTVAWHALPDNPLRRAHLEVIKGLWVRLPPEQLEGPDNFDNCSFRHVNYMLGQLIRNLGEWPTDKISRWIGFVQGVLATRGYLNVGTERNNTRPIFQKAYAEMAEAQVHSKAQEEKASILDWLHTGGGPSHDGWEYGVMRVKFDQHGQFIKAEWTLSDHSDVLEMMRQEMTGMPIPLPGQPQPP